MDLVDKNMSARELQKMMDAVHNKGKYKRPDFGTRTLELGQFFEGPLAAPEALESKATRLAIGTKTRPNPWIFHGAEFSQMTMRVEQGRGMWLRVKIVPACKEIAPPALAGAQIVELSVSKALRKALPLGAPWGLHFKPMLQRMLRFAAQVK
ncbi:MAG: hypothetical protein HYT79_12170 [Elusimicrobia bacterium]|nr:hypothetical protein [Elusimicrobiota bacterium]